MRAMLPHVMLVFEAMVVLSNLVALLLFVVCKLAKKLKIHLHLAQVFLIFTLTQYIYM